MDTYKFQFNQHETVNLNALLKMILKRLFGVGL